MGAGNSKDVLGPEVSPQHGAAAGRNKDWSDGDLPWKKQTSPGNHERRVSKGDSKLSRQQLQQQQQQQQQQQGGRNSRGNNKKDSKSKNSRDKNSGDNETELDNHIKEIVTTVDNVEAKATKDRKKRRGFGNLFGRSPVAPKDEDSKSEDAKVSSGARSAPEATRQAPGDAERKGSAPVTAPTTNGKRARARGGLRRQSVVVAEPPPEDEWEYQQVVVEGFDPEKFKKANVTKKPAMRSNGFQGLNLGPLSEDGLGSLSHNSDPYVLRIRQTEKQQLVVPPAYDVTEEQLMKSIEKEFNMT